jgi:hypothetical protein
MDLQTWGTLVSVVVAIVALFWAGHSAYSSRDSAAAARDAATAAEDQARAVEEQTQPQRYLAKVAAEPNLWVDICADEVTGAGLVLLVGNSGPSIARHVKVTFDPPVKVKHADVQPVLETLREGISAIAPGRTVQWNLGTARFTVDWDAPNVYRVRIEADGPLGAIEPLEYVISVDDLALSNPAATGNLLGVTTQLQDISRSARQLSEAAAKLQGTDPLSMIRRAQRANGQGATENERGDRGGSLTGDDLRARRSVRQWMSASLASLVAKTNAIKRPPRPPTAQ